MHGWVNNSEAGDLGGHRAHYDGIVMIQIQYSDPLAFYVQITRKTWFITWSLLQNMCVIFIGVNIVPLLFYRDTIVYINVIYFAKSSLHYQYT